MEAKALRIAAGAALAVAVSCGLVLSDKMGRDSRDRMQELAEHRVDAQEVHAEVAQRREGEAFDPALFAAHVAEDADGFGVETDLVELGEAQEYTAEVGRDPVVLAPGQSWAGSRLSAKASLEKVRFMQHGAMISARHAVLRVTNRSPTPVAYFVSVRSHDRGTCDVRGARMHNAMSLMPEETAEIVVCAGKGKVRIDRLDALAISELGHHYLSQVPPLTVGYDAITDSAHSPMKRVEMCDHLETKATASRIAEGLARWVDVADFFSRHNCHRFEFPPGYRHDPEPLDSLPVRP